MPMDSNMIFLSSFEMFARKEHISFLVLSVVPYTGECDHLGLLVDVGSEGGLLLLVEIIIIRNAEVVMVSPE
jgi:hypothetical protein